MFPGAKIIAVDDELDELNEIVNSLKKLGMACISYKYPDETPEEGDLIPGVRLLFLDINLLGGGSPQQGANVLNAPISMIQRIISEENGPYVLVTWSSTEKHEELCERIDNLDSLANKRPFYSRSLSKAEFLGDPDRLKVEIEKIFSENPAFSALVDWERRVSLAGESVLNDIENFSLEFEDDNYSEKMDRLLSKLAVDAFGSSHVENHRFEAVNEALMPMLSDALNSEFLYSTDVGSWDDAVTKFADPNEIAPEIVSRLNSAVVIEVSSEIYPHRRGAILTVPTAWQTDEEFEKRFGARPSRIRGEVLKLDQPKSLTWVLVQSQAACDFAQNRIGPIPYLLGALVPVDRVVKTDKDGQDLKLPDSVFQTPRLSSVEGLSDTDFYIQVIHGISCTVTPSILNETDFTVIGRLKDQIISTITYEYHSHGARPGFVSFR